MSIRVQSKQNDLTYQVVLQPLCIFYVFLVERKLRAAEVVTTVVDKERKGYGDHFVLFQRKYESKQACNANLVAGNHQSRGKKGQQPRRGHRGDTQVRDRDMMTYLLL